MSELEIGSEGASFLLWDVLDLNLFVKFVLGVDYSCQVVYVNSF